MKRFINHGLSTKGSAVVARWRGHLKPDCLVIDDVSSLMRWTVLSPHRPIHTLTLRIWAKLIPLDCLLRVRGRMALFMKEDDGSNYLSVPSAPSIQLCL